MMLRMGFDERWVGWMTMCLETVSYSVLVNGEKVDPITQGIGLRQGDPLSPFLFIICAEGLSTLLKKVEGRGDIHGVRVCRGASFSHTYFLLIIVSCFVGQMNERVDT